MPVLLSSPSKNAIQKTLAAQLLSTATTADPITFDDVDGLPNLPGVLVIRRVDTSGVATPAFREYIEYSGTSGNTVLITTRNVDGSNAALTHPVGSIVEFIPDVTWADRIYDALALVVDINDISAINSSLITQTSKSLTVESPTATEDISMFFTSEAVTITKMACVLTGSATPSLTWTVKHGTDRSAAGAAVVTAGTVTTSTTTGSIVTSFNDATIPANSYVWFETTAQSGTVDSSNLTIIYDKD